MTKRWFFAHYYAMPSNFTGRISEKKMLSNWLEYDNKTPLLLMRALGGFGKSALVWQWINTDVKPTKWSKLIWWSFYERESSFEYFVEEVLKYLNLKVPQGQRLQIGELLNVLQRQKILIIMDGFERALQAYGRMNAAYLGDENSEIEVSQLDCININAEFFLRSLCSIPNLKSKVLITTRLTPRVVKSQGVFLRGCREEVLDGISPQDAVEFFYKHGIRGTRVEIETICESYGYHPLSLRLLAGFILKDYETPGDIKAAQKLQIGDNLVQHRHHILEVSYNNLTPKEQYLLKTIACFYFPVSFMTLETIFGTEESLGENLYNLEKSGLIQCDQKYYKYSLSPIVRSYVYERQEKKEQIQLHYRLAEYFKTVEVPAEIQSLEEIAPLIELYHHTSKLGDLDVARELYYNKIQKILFYQFRAYQLQIKLLLALFPYGEDREPALRRDDAKAGTLNELANAYALSGQPHRAVVLLSIANRIYEGSTKYKQHLAIGLSNLAQQQLNMGSLMECKDNLSRSIILCREISNIFDEANCKQELGRALCFMGLWEDAEREMIEAQKVFDRYGINKTNYVSVVRSYLSQLFILKKEYDLAMKLAEEAFYLALSFQEKFYGGERDVIRAQWLQGIVYRLNGQFELATYHLSEAIKRERAVNLIDMEANLLIELAQLQYDIGNFEKAKSLASESLMITERCGYVLQGAEVNLFFAKYSIHQDKNYIQAKEYAQKARKLATCDDSPYFYKRVYEEAERLLNELQ